MDEKNTSWSVGTIHGDYKIIEKISSTRVKAECIHCGSVINILAYMLKNNSSCRNRECKFFNSSNSTFPKYIVGSTFGDYKILERLSNQYLKIKCIYCGEERVLTRSALLNSSTCKNEDCSHFIKEERPIPKYYIGAIIGYYKIIERIDESTVKVQCIYCEDTRTISIPALRRNSSCRECEYDENLNSHVKMQRRGYVYKKGESYNNLKVVNLLEDDKYMVKCLECGEEFFVDRSVFRSATPYHCKNINCKNYYGRRGTTLVGEIRHNLKCLGYVEYKTNGKSKRSISIKLKCLDCGKEFSVVNTSLFEKGRIVCVNKNCKNSENNIEVKEDLETKFKRRFEGFDVIGPGSSYDKIIVKCKECGTKFEITKYGGNKCVCKNENCLTGRPKLVNCIGKTFGDFIITDIVNVKEIHYKCKLCGEEHVGEYLPSENKLCNSHPRRTKYKMVFRNFKILEYSYTYKSVDYFICECLKCGKKDILSVKQMLEHRCQD